MATTVESRLEAEKYIGMGLALTSGILIGTSFIITKMGLNDSNKTGGLSSGEGFEYLKNPMWWAGTTTMVLGEVANFLAYSYAPAILVTPLGAVSVLVGAILSHFFLKERLGRDGIIGCTLCILGSVMVILHSPEEEPIETVDDVFHQFTRPLFMLYIAIISALSVYLIYEVGPKIGKRNMFVYITICSLVGSISVMAVKGLSVAVKLTFAGENQFGHLSTWLFLFTVVGCAMTQVNYFNKALDLFSTNRVTPIYYVFFTTATIVASVILTEGVSKSSPVEMISVLAGFATIFIGVFMVNESKQQNQSLLEKSFSNSRTSVHKSAHPEFHLLKTFNDDVQYDEELQ
ncbi:magnesium transporter [Gorgonomyces haynaldii]|nr:magnesium transporter [Gorgonomyces haynaldii]